MRSFLPLVLPVIFTLGACKMQESSDQVNDKAADQVSSGAVSMPTITSPVSLGAEGMMYLYCGNADEGCFGTVKLNLCGTSPDFAIQWDPALCNDAFGTFTTDDSMAFVTQLPWPSAGRGNAATEDAVPVDWSTSDGSELGSEGYDDGWYNLPTTNGVQNIEMVSDCGSYHPNIVWGWDGVGAVKLPTNVASYGEDYCDQ